jgi:sulfate adenylyltransferase
MSLQSISAPHPPAPSRGTTRGRRTESIRVDEETRGELDALLSDMLRPVTGFLDHEDWLSVRRTMRLTTGRWFPVPLALTLPEDVGVRLNPGDGVTLRDDEGTPLAVMQAVSVWIDATGTWHAGGPVESASRPPAFDLQEFRTNPDAVRAWLAACGHKAAIGASPGALLHPERRRAVFRLADGLDAAVVFLPLLRCGAAPRLDPLARLQSMRAALTPEERRRSIFMVIPLQRRYRRAQELLVRAIAARNCGCTHVDFADEGALSPNAIDTRCPEEAGRELGITWVNAQPPIARPFTVPPIAAEEYALATALIEGREVESATLCPEALSILRRRHPLRHEQGFTVFLTGYSGSGKSTIARALKARLEQRVSRPVTLLDGDVVRTHLSSELGFSREHRDLNVRRIGFVAAEITRHRGIAICAPIAPYDATRRAARSLVEAHGGFVLVHVATPLAVCEARDPKGLYAKARAGTLPAFTGVSDPYEVPADASLEIDSSVLSPDDAATRIIDRLASEGYLRCP